MIKSVTVTNYLGVYEKITLNDSNPNHGLLIRSISGLGPVKADVNTTSMATNDGTFFNSAKLGERNVVIDFIFEYAPTIEDTRQRTYQLFPTKKSVELIIETDNRILQMSGYVESNEPTIFSNLEGCQISIICPDPFMYSAGNSGLITEIFCGIEPTFEFVFSNESLSNDLINFGNIEDYTEKDIYYDGDSEVGVRITIHAIGEVGNITIYNTGTREVMKIDSGKIKQITGYKESEYGIIFGDDIIISTVRGSKNVLLLRNGEYTNILNSLSKDSDWFQLTRGSNIFAYVADYGLENLQFKMEYRLVYPGI